jgi:hypothetical protein
LEKKSFEQQQVSRYVRSTASYIEVWYEQLFGAGSVGALQNLSTFLHLPDLAEQKPTFTKQISRPYAELIENYDEVESALNTSQFASLIGAHA